MNDFLVAIILIKPILEKISFNVKLGLSFGNTEFALSFKKIKKH